MSWSEQSNFFIKFN